MTENDKTAIYPVVAQEIDAVLQGESNVGARMATIATMLHHAFDRFIWTGFYVVDPADPGQLVVGPYQGALGCLRIPFGKGVCGTAAARRETVIVDDVHDFPGHIACDPRSVSELVAPVFDKDGRLIAVLDIDSDRRAAFDEVDRAELETIVKTAFADTP